MHTPLELIRAIADPHSSPPGLTRGSILSSQGLFAKVMDCRVKPGNDSYAAVAPSDIAQGGEHPGLEVVEQMAMQRPKPGIVGVEGDHDPAPRRDQHRVAHRAGKALAVDLDHLKFVPVQVHRVLHPRLVDEDKLDALALCDG